jgi:hypothetical protein
MRMPHHERGCRTMKRRRHPRDDLDYHFLAVFTPADRTAPDGRRHEPIEAGLTSP